MEAGPLLPFPTEEQRSILACLRRGTSLRIVANAGTGKTRTLLQAAAEARRSCLFLAFNRDIREEVQQWASSSPELQALDVENYDSLLVNYYDKTAAYQDFQLSMQRVLDEDAEPLTRKRWEVVYIDEAQDLDERYTLFVRKILRDHAPGSGGEEAGEEASARTVQLVSVGDPKQSIFKYRGADAQFFLGTSLHEGRVQQLHLTESFRFGPSVCSFLDALCSPLFQTYLPHRSSAQDAPVERWLLRDDGSPALVARLQTLHAELRFREHPEERLLTFLSGSLKESNAALWTFVEELASAASSPPQAEQQEEGSPPGEGFLVVDSAQEQPRDGGALAMVKNVHSCKGKTFQVAVLFLTNRRSWLDEQGRVEKEALYVALTRGRKLILVEHERSLLFQDVCLAAGVAPEQMPPLVCGRTGSVYAQGGLFEKRCGGGYRRALFAKPHVEEKASKMPLAYKQRLLSLIDAPALAVWDENPEEEDLSGKERLRHLAAWVRFEHALREERSEFNDFLSHLKSVPVADAYALLRKSKHAPLAAFLSARLQRLAGKDAWDARDFLDLCRFHPSFHYGYLALPAEDEEDVRTSQAIFQAIGACYARLHQPQKIHEIRSVSMSLGAPGFFLAGPEVVLLKADGGFSESLCDRLLAAYVSVKVGASSYAIRYASAEGPPETERAAVGSVSAQNKASYARSFEEALKLTA